MTTLFPIDLTDFVPTPQFAKLVTTAAATQQQQVAAVAGKKIRVLAYALTSTTGANNLTFRTASTDISGVLAFAAAGEKLIAPFSPVGHFETVAGEALNTNSSAAVVMGGHIVYVLV